MPALAPRHLKVVEVAARYGVNQTKVGVWIASGELRAVDVSTKRGGKPRWRIPLDALLEFELSRSVSPVAERQPRRRRRRQPDAEDFIRYY